MSNKQLLISCLEAVSSKCLCFATPKELCMSFFLFFLKVLKLAICMATACPSGYSSIPRYSNTFRSFFLLFFPENRIQTFCHLILCKCSLFSHRQFKLILGSVFSFTAFQLSLKKCLRRVAVVTGIFFPLVKCKSLTSQV